MTLRCTACRQEAPDEPAVGDVCPHCRRLLCAPSLTRYVDVELIGRGGMGAVYRARDEALGTTVAIKVVRVQGASSGMFERFQREARLAARIAHPGVVRVYATDSGEGRLFLVMEHVEGATLRAKIQQGSLDVPWCIDKAVQLCDVLHAAHTAGIVHRDIKPENVLIDTTGRVRVLDFGVSRLTESEERLTRTGEILGTPEYLAPEQILDEPEAVDARTDVYATGVVLYEMLTGVSPFAGANLFQVLKYVESRVPAPPSSLRGDLPEGLDDVVMAALAKDKRERPSDSLSLARSLRSFGAGSGGVRSARGRALAGLFAVLGFLLGLFWNSAVGTSAEPVRPEQQREPTPAETLRSLLAAPEAMMRWQLEDAIRAIPRSASPEDAYQRGLARKYCGQLVAARRDFEAARFASVAGAEDQLAALWHYENTFVATLVGRGRWFVRARLPAGESEWQKAMAQLADGDAAGAFAKLEAWGGTAALANDRRALLALSAKLSKNTDRAARLVAEPSDYTPLAVVRAWVLGDDDELREAIGRIDRQAAARYLLEAAVAARDADIPRLRATSELALVAGAEREATMLYAGSRIDLVLAAGSNASLAADEASRLLSVLGKRRMPEYPGLSSVRFVLSLFARNQEVAKTSLDGLPESFVPAVRDAVAGNTALKTALTNYAELSELAKQKGVSNAP